MLKPLLVLARITFVGCLWSIIFIEGIRVIVLENWRFDIFWPAHWVYAWNLWQAGWVIDTPKEWAFVLILLAFIPLWLTGWIALSIIPWENLIYRILVFPFKFIKRSVEPLKQVTNSTPVVTKKKSYKEVRPAGKRTPIYEYNVQTPVAQPSVPLNVPPQPAVTQAPAKNKAAVVRETLNHAIFDMDDDDEDFDLGIDSVEKTNIFDIDSNKNKEKKDVRTTEYTADKQKETSHKFDFDEEDTDDDLETYKPVKSLSESKAKRFVAKDRDDGTSDRNERRRSEYLPEKSKASSRGSIGDVLENKGYDVLRNINIKKTVVDYVAVAQEKVLLCIVDKEPGDWLADEERFNDEEPLWFSENSHRISPVRKADLARQKFEAALEDSDLNLEVIPYVVIVAGNVINAEDMLDVWSDMGIKVARFAKGSPTDLTSLPRVIEQAEEKLSRNEMSEFKKLLKKLV